ncbi:hypothetical protein Hypma_012730 [Hypsizygus marmoreus]|uniref:Peptidase A2 domain-containing protein n=1 Tax=Hypsizygus marmoreus TaxID=39966 RepID=A0A369JJT1_HYPMA|nr:hypothetical protein Hypma_012730 [Hypsizygus marmoreus]
MADRESSLTDLSNRSDTVPPDASFDLPGIEELAEAASPEDFTGESTATMIDLPTLAVFHSYRSNDELATRRNIALRLGAEALEKYFLVNTNRVFTRRLWKDVFMEEAQRMDDIFSDCLKKPTADGFAFSLRRDKYSALLGLLMRIRTKLSNILIANGEPIPDLPYWGPKGDLNEYFYENEFEVYGVCFRAEVERFLHIFDEHYNFLTDLPRNPDLILRDSPAEKQQTQSTPRPTNRNRRQDGHHHDYQGQSASRIETGGPRSYRTSNIYHQGDGTARRDRARGARDASNRVPATSRMREVLSDIGRTFHQHEDNDRSTPILSASHPNRRRHPGPSDDPSDGDDDDDGSGNGRGGHGRQNGGGPPRNPGRRPEFRNEDQMGRRTDPSRPSVEPHFDNKLKFENVPKWDGNTDTIVRWLSKVNNIARMSVTVFNQLGSVVPRRFKGPAETWYWSLPSPYRDEVEQNWDTLRSCISSYYMNRKWLDKQKARATRAHYRETGYGRETPSEYYIRKAELLNTVYTLDDSEVILEIMEGAPANWNTVLTTQLYTDVIEFQSAIRFHEDTLMRLESNLTVPTYRRKRFESNYRDQGHPRDPPRVPHSFPRTNLVGASRGMEPPKFPKDDNNVSRRSAIPEQKGARPCRHCGSGKHWDNECKHAFKGNRAARANLASVDEETLQAQKDYDGLYYDLDSEEEDHTSETQQDFCNSLRTSDEGEVTVPEGSSVYENETKSYQVKTASPKSIIKTPLNRRSRRRLARDVTSSSFRTYTSPAQIASDKGLIELKKVMARPLGCSFLGSRATQATANIGGLDIDPTNVIIDSGSDITLISQKTLDSLISKPKIRQGQKIKLIQVTGTSSISGFVTLDLFFHTPQGPIKLSVEAYMVRGMSTPFILGNDFQDQYSISILRQDGETTLSFADSGRELPVSSSTSVASLLDEDGHAFKIRISPEFLTSMPRNRSHRRNQKLKRRAVAAKNRSEVRASKRVVIPPMTSCIVPVDVSFNKGSDSIFVERQIDAAGNFDDLYGSADSIISRKEPVLHVANFSNEPVVIGEGQSKHEQSPVKPRYPPKPNETQTIQTIRRWENP